MREKVKYPHFFKLIEREKNFCRLVVRDDEFNFQFSFMEPSHWTAHPLSTLSLCMKFQLWIFNKVSISWLTLSRSSSPFVNLRHEKWVLKRELPPSVRKFALGSPLDGVVMCVGKLRLIQFFFLALLGNIFPRCSRSTGLSSSWRHELLRYFSTAKRNRICSLSGRRFLGLSRCYRDMEFILMLMFLAYTYKKKWNNFFTLSLLECVSLALKSIAGCMIKSHKFPWDELAIDEENFEFHNFFWAVGNAIKKIEKHEKSCNERVLNSVDKLWVFNDFFLLLLACEWTTS